MSAADISEKNDKKSSYKNKENVQCHRSEVNR